MQGLHTLRGLFRFLARPIFQLRVLRVMQPVNKPHGIRVPLIGGQPSQEQMAKIQVMQAIQGMAMGIYTQLAAGYISRLDDHQEFDADQLRETAKHCHAAAQAFFEGLGVIEVRN